MIPCQRGGKLVLAKAFSKLQPLKYLDQRSLPKVYQHLKQLTNLTWKQKPC